MDPIEDILKLDDLDRGSFGSLEKHIGYAILLCMTVPILLIPFVYATLHRSIFKVTFFLLLVLSLLVFTVHFKFSWLVWLSEHIQQSLTRFNHARVRV